MFKKVYKKNKYLKNYVGIEKRHNSVLYLYTKPQNLKKELDSAEQAVAKQKSKKKKYLSIAMFILVLGIVIVNVVIQLNANEISPENLKISTLINATTFSVPLFFFLFIFFLGIMLVDSFRFNVLIKKTTGRSRFFLSYKTASLGRFYDLITPMSAGGQPFQVFYLNKRGLNASSAISVPMAKYVIGQICSIVLMTVVIFSSTIWGFEINPTLKVACILGYFLNLFLITAIIFLMVSKKVGKKIVVWVLKFLQKIKIIKNYEKQYNNVMKTVNDFQTTIIGFTKSPKTFVRIILISFLYLAFNYSMVFCVYSCLVGKFDFSYWYTIICMGVLIDMASCFIPLPGGSGASELSFGSLISILPGLSGSVLIVWALLLWKFMTYIIYLIQGLFVIIYDKLVGDRKYKWLKKKWELESESLNFNNDKIQEYTHNKDKTKII